MPRAKGQDDWHFPRITSIESSQPHTSLNFNLQASGPPSEDKEFGGVDYGSRYDEVCSCLSLLSSPPFFLSSLSSLTSALHSRVPHPNVLLFMAGTYSSSFNIQHTHTTHTFTDLGACARLSWEHFSPSSLRTLSSRFSVCTQLGNLMMITEFMPNGSLESVIEKRKDLTAFQRMRFAKDAGMYTSI